MRLKANLLLLVVSMIWGSSFVTQSIAGQHKIAYLFNAASFILAGLILLPLIPKKTIISKAQWKWMGIAGAVLFFAASFQQVGLLYTKVANASFLTSLYTVFTPFLLWLGFRERPHWLEALAVSLAGLGAFLLSASGGLHLYPGDSLEIFGAFFWAVHFVILGKFASRFEAISFSAGHFLVSGFANLAVGLFVEDVAVLTLPPILGAILYRAVLSIAVGYTLQVWGQKHTAPTDAALILSLEGVFAAIAGWLVLEQYLQLIQILGCAIIFVAVLISQFKEWTSGKITHDQLVEGR
ncbi:MAG: DMT family transporter [Anaerolineales bacterium]|nr:DMT family transporter [Anaerolineales bacterium]